MSEAGIKREIRLAIGGRDDTRLFNNPVGVAIYPDGSRVNYGLHVGAADCVGWRSVEITADMVGKRVAVFCSIEVKGPRGRPTPEQKNWSEQVRAAGGLAGFARSVADALKIITGG